MRQKVQTVDGVWSAVGTTNFDHRAFKMNDQITLGIHSEAFAKEIEEIFAKDGKVFEELKLAKWKGRGLPHKLRDYAFLHLQRVPASGA